MFAGSLDPNQIQAIEIDLAAQLSSQEVADNRTQAAVIKHLQQQLNDQAALIASQTALINQLTTAQTALTTAQTALISQYSGIDARCKAASSGQAAGFDTQSAGVSTQSAAYTACPITGALALLLVVHFPSRVCCYAAGVVVDFTLVFIVDSAAVPAWSTSNAVFTTEFIAEGANALGVTADRLRILSIAQTCALFGVFAHADIVLCLS